MDAATRMISEYIRNKEIDIKKVVENGKAKAVPTNEKTLQRMKFAEKIREDMSKQRELFAGKGAKPVKEQELNNSQSIPSL